MHTPLSSKLIAPDGTLADAGLAAADRCPFQRAVAAGAGTSESSRKPLVRAMWTQPPHRDRDDAPAGTLILVGVNHHTAPVELRERFCQSGDLAGMLADLRAAGLAEAAILFTCNRFEVYAVVGAASRDAVTEYLAARCRMPVHELVPTLYYAEAADAALHLMRVASGLESVVLGEPQILGQVADALAYADKSHAIGPVLTRLFTSAVHAGKRARTETAIGRHTLSISHAGVMLLQSARPLSDARVLVLGAGEMARLAIRALQAHGAGSLVVINRTHSRALALAQGTGIRVARWDDLAVELASCDAVIAATGSTLPVITTAHVSNRTAERPVQLIDLGVPRNVEFACATLPGVHLHNVDDLERVVESHRVQRQREASRVEELLDEELDEYTDWVRTRTLAPVIARLREQAATLTSAQLEKTLKRLPDLSDEARTLIEQMARHISGGLMHAATVALKSRDTVLAAAAESNAPSVDVPAEAGAVDRA